jgi:DNA-binding MarR family transcriptional regulator
VREVRGATEAIARNRVATQQLAIWRALIDTTNDLRRVFAAELLRESNLSAADYQVLLALSEAEGRRMRSSELAAAIDWERSRLSHHLARMERRDLIRRDNCATDSRGAEISLTEEGAGMFRRATAPHVRAVQAHFADALTPEQLDALAEILAALQRHLHSDPPVRAAGERS